MSIKIIKKITFLFIFILSSNILNAEEDLKSLGKFKNWETFKLIQENNKICFAQSLPLIRSPKSFEREPSRLFVTFRPAEKIVNEISLTNGYEFKKASQVTIKSGKKAFKLFSKGKFAWALDADELKLIKAMKKASRVMIRGTGTKGNPTTDHYSMMGFTKAYNLAKKNCT